MVCKELQKPSEKLLEHLDFFKQPIPTLNFEGKDKASSIYGSCLSIIMVLVFVVYADFKLSILINR